MITGLAVVGVVTLATLGILEYLFRRLRGSEKVQRQYVRCAGGWWEGEIENCESGMGLVAIPQQPVNTYTNLAFAAGGGVLVSVHLWPIHALFLAVLVYMTVGSGLYHAISTRWAASLDVSSMYATFYGLLGYGFAVLVGWGPWETFALTVIGMIGAGYFLRYRYGGRMELKIGLLLAGSWALLVARLLTQGGDGWLLFWVSTLCYAFAMISWLLDKTRRSPIPRWGHGFWHILAALAIVTQVLATGQGIK